MRIFVAAAAVFLLAPTSLGALPIAPVGEPSLLVLAQDSKSEPKDKTKKQKMKSTGGSAPQTGTPGGKSDSY
jgi:hypothetical protein